MRREIELREPERDPALAAALRHAYADATLGAERAAALRARIRTQASGVAPREQPLPAAQLRLAGVAALSPAQRFRSRRAIWAVPALLAASLAGVLLIRRTERGLMQAPQAPPAAAVGFSSAEQALRADVSDAEFARLVTRQDDPAALLAIAVEASPSTRSR